MTSDRIGGYHADSLAPAILQLHAEGFRGGDIAAHLGCSHANVSQTLTRYGQANQRKPTVSTDARALALAPAARLAYIQDPNPDRLAALLSAKASAPMTTPTSAHPALHPGPACACCTRRYGLRLREPTAPGYGPCRTCHIVTAIFPPSAWTPAQADATHPAPSPTPTTSDGIEETIDQGDGEGDTTTGPA